MWNNLKTQIGALQLKIVTNKYYLYRFAVKLKTPANNQKPFTEMFSKTSDFETSAFHCLIRKEILKYTWSCKVILST